jgi:predicted ArsR family transcriptional regulator
MGYLRHNGVVEIGQHLADRPMPAQEQVALDCPGPIDDRIDPALIDGAVEDRTRDRVCRVILQQGPVSAGELSRTLGLTAAGVRRHLDLLLEQGLISVHEPSAHQHRPRGRPARLFVLTDTGHAAMATGYDDLAAQALRFVSRTGGPEAVRQFAEQRLADFERRYRPMIEAAGPDPGRRAEALATALSLDGFAASTRSPTGQGAASIGTQLCQGHCPVQHVAREFPELCEAETDTFSRLLGVHVQRLATLAHGEHVCTTHVPHVRQMTAPQLVTSAARSSEPSQER